MKQFYRITPFIVLVAIIANSTFFNFASALFNIPSSANIITEYLFSGSVLDTSGNNNTTIGLGDITTKFDSNANIPYAQFSGSGQIAALLPWNGDSTSPFTIGFWIKTSIDDRTNTVNIYKDPVTCATGYTLQLGTTADFANHSNTGYSTYNLSSLSGTGCYGQYVDFATIPVSYNTKKASLTQTNVFFYYNYTGSYLPDNFSKTQNTQVIFTTKKLIGSLGTDLGLRLTKTYSCELESGNTFDCSMLNDGGWHYMTLRRDYYGTFNAIIDNAIKATWRNSGVTIGRVLSIGKGTAYGTENEFMKLKSKIAGFRFWNKDLSDIEITQLQQEFSVTQLPTNPSIPTITINQPDTTQTSSKRITASSSTGTLSYAIVSSETCNDTITSFDNYTDLIFSSPNDNGYRICYKAVNGINKVFKISAPIGGIIGVSSMSQSAPNYKSFPSSPKVRADDYLFSAMGNMNIPGYPYTSISNYIDLNGDGLVDIMTRVPGTNTVLEQRTILLNNGDLTFKLGYKCYYDSTTQYFYGDCADINYK